MDGNECDPEDNDEDYDDCMDHHMDNNCADVCEEDELPTDAEEEEEGSGDVTGTDC